MGNPNPYLYEILCKISQDFFSIILLQAAYRQLDTFTQSSLLYFFVFRNYTLKKKNQTQVSLNRNFCCKFFVPLCRLEEQLQHVCLDFKVYALISKHYFG